MKALTLTAIGLVAALTASAAAADTILRTTSGAYVVLLDDPHVATYRTSRVAVLPRHHSLAQAVPLVDLIAEMPRVRAFRARPYPGARLH